MELKLNREQLTDLDDIKDRSAVREVVSTGTELILVFQDAFIVLYYDSTIGFCVDNEDLGELGDSLVEAGLITEENYRAYRDTNEKEYEEWREQHDRMEYEKLKLKFEKP